MLNITNFKHITVQAKLFEAMRKSMFKGYPQYITNKRGQNYLRVERVKGKVINAFRFLDKAGNDVSKSVYAALKAA